MVHLALNLPERRIPPLFVRRSFGLPFWLYSLSLAFVLLGDERLKLKAFKFDIYSLAQETVDPRSLQRLAGKTTSSRSFTVHPYLLSCHLVKLPLSPLMFLPSFWGVFCIRDFWIFGKVSLLFVRQVIRTKRPFCEVLNWGWGGVISLLIVEIRLKCVTVLVRASQASEPLG